MYCWFMKCLRTVNGRLLHNNYVYIIADCKETPYSFHCKNLKKLTLDINKLCSLFGFTHALKHSKHNL